MAVDYSRVATLANRLLNTHSLRLNNKSLRRKSRIKNAFKNAW